MSDWKEFITNLYYVLINITALISINLRRIKFLKMIDKSKIQTKGNLNCVLNYLAEQCTIDLNTLNFSPVKTKEQFLTNYSLHDNASSYVALKYLQNNFSLHPIGKDLRDQRVMIKNEVPDYYSERIVDIETREDNINFCFDVKSKRNLDYFGWVNERAIHGYKRLTAKCNVKIFLVFILMENNIPTDNFGYSNISEAPIYTKIAWDQNKVLIYNWYKGLPFLL